MAFALLTGLAACTSPQPAPPPPPPASAVAEYNGLRTSIAKVQRSATGIEATYVLEWTAKGAIECTIEPGGTLGVRGENLWLLEPVAPLYVRFWNATGDLVAETSQRIELPSRFRDYSETRREFSVLLPSAPSGAVSLSIALAVSGLETKRALIP